MLHGRFVHVGKTLTDLQIFGLRMAPKCVWWPGSSWTRLGSCSAPPDHLAVIWERRGKGRGRKELEIGR